VRIETENPRWTRGRQSGGSHVLRWRSSYGRRDYSCAVFMCDSYRRVV
jgi:hypothetical protein